MQANRMSRKREVAILVGGTRHSSVGCKKAKHAAMVDVMPPMPAVSLRRRGGSRWGQAAAGPPPLGARRHATRCEQGLDRMVRWTGARRKRERRWRWWELTSANPRHSCPVRPTHSNFQILDPTLYLAPGPPNSGTRPCSNV
jgi:hypothetical protein